MADNKDILLKIKHLHKQFGEFSPITDVTFDVENGDVVSIIGPSGTGKSTILRCINFLEHPTSGKIYLHGKEISESSKNIIEARKKIGMVFQNFNLFNNFNVIDNIIKPQVDILGKSREEAKKYALELLGDIGLADKANYNINDLSGGQKQRVAILRSIALEPELLLLDEPTSALDPSCTNEVLNLIKRLALNNITMIIVTHEMEFAKNVSNKILFVDEGVIYEQGSPEEIFDNPKKDKTKEFIQNIRIKKYSKPVDEFDFVEFLSSTMKLLSSNGCSNILMSKVNLLLEEVLAESILPSGNFCTMTIDTSCSINGEIVLCNVCSTLNDSISSKVQKITQTDIFSEATNKIIAGVCSKHNVDITDKSVIFNAEICEK